MIPLQEKQQLERRLITREKTAVLHEWNLQKVRVDQEIQKVFSTITTTYFPASRTRAIH